MKILVVSSKNNCSKIKRVIGHLSNNNTYTYFTLYNDNSRLSKNMYLYDAIIICIDNETIKNMNEYNKDFLQEFIERYENKKITVTFDKLVEDPTWLSETFVISCTSGSINAYKQAQEELKIYMEDDIITNKKRFIYFAIAFFATLGIIFALLSGVSRFTNIPSKRVSFFEITSVIFVVIAYILIAIFKIDEKENNEYERYSKEVQGIIKRKSKYLHSKEQNASSGNEECIDALEYMLVNLKNIKEYYVWSQKQAKSSFILAVALIVIGIIIIGASLGLSISLKLDNIVIIVGTIGGVVTEFIAGTSLVVYNKSLSQLNYYHKSLHEDERFLSSVNLLSNFSTKELKDDMLKEIIRSEINMNNIRDFENEK